MKLSKTRDTHESLDPSEFGLTEADLDKTFYTHLADPPRTTLRKLIAILRETYCRTVGVEYMHIRNPKVRRWLQERMESARNHPRLRRQAEAPDHPGSCTRRNSSRRSCTRTTSARSGSRWKAARC